MNALQKFSLVGKVALVTGGSRGLGRAMAEALGDAGAAVAVTARTLASAEAAAEELSGLGIRAYGVQLEVSDVEDVERAVEQVSTEFGEIDVLLNNAGIGVAGRDADRLLLPGPDDGTDLDQAPAIRSSASSRRSICSAGAPGMTCERMIAARTSSALPATLSMAAMLLRFPSVGACSALPGW